MSRAYNSRFKENQDVAIELELEFADKQKELVT